MPDGPSGVPTPRRRAGRVAAAAEPPAHPPARSLAVRIGHAFGITSRGRAVVLVVVVCASALSVAVPLRNYVTQRSELSAVREQQEMLTDQVAELERRRALLEDPRHVEAQARERLRYVRPGETPYVVQLPPAPPSSHPIVVQEPEDPWFTRFWDAIVGD
jgi:cell division protein FtsB